MKKVLAMVLASSMLLSFAGCGGQAANTSSQNGASTPKASGVTDIAILVPNADHGWTGAVMSYAEKKAAEINAGGKYTAKVITSTNATDQISQVEDLIENATAKNAVILPQDNTLEAAMKKLASSNIPFVMFDRIIDSVADKAVSSVKGDNEGIGKATAERFMKDGMKPGDKILIMPGDNSSVPEMRNNGFFGALKEKGWTDTQIKEIKSTAYTGWSRSEGKKLFTEWLDSNTLDTIGEYKWIFTHDDEIAMGILEALKSSDIDAAKKSKFLSSGVHLSSSSGLNEIYSVMKNIHQKDYSKEFASLGDLFSVTYDPAMIQIAAQDMVDHLDGKKVDATHVVPVHVVDSSNAKDFQGFGDAVSK